MIKSPLRYPGGKSKAAKLITRYFPPITEMTSPFFGGGSIEISQALKGVRVRGYDVFAPLVCFWQHLFSDREALYREVQKLHPMTKENFKKLQNCNPDMPYGVEKAAVFYALNRSSFSGSTMSGGMSEGQRFNQSNMQTILKFDVPSLTVEEADFETSILSNPSDFLYLDPPYLLARKSNKLYGVKGSTHQDFDHERLFNLLKDRKNWIMSYNSGSEIAAMYEGFPMIEPKWAYGMSADKNSKEFLIASPDLAERILVDENL